MNLLYHLLLQMKRQVYLNEKTGIKMSGGERQRICIGRAILKNAPIVIFGEATSFTNGDIEHKI